MFSNLYQLRLPKVAKTVYVLQCESRAYQVLIVSEILLQPMLSHFLLVNVHEQPVHVHHTQITNKLHSRDSKRQLKFLRQKSEKSLIMALIQIRLSLAIHIRTQKRYKRLSKFKLRITREKRHRQLGIALKQNSSSRRIHQILSLNLRKKMIPQKIIRTLLNRLRINRSQMRWKNLKSILILQVLICSKARSTQTASWGQMLRVISLKSRWILWTTRSCANRLMTFAIVKLAKFQ